jgi:hypothetical protein
MQFYLYFLNYRSTPSRKVFNIQVQVFEGVLYFSVILLKRGFKWEAAE